LTTIVYANDCPVSNPRIASVAVHSGILIQAEFHAIVRQRVWQQRKNLCSANERDPGRV